MLTAQDRHWEGEVHHAKSSGSFMLGGMQRPDRGMAGTGATCDPGRQRPVRACQPGGPEVGPATAGETRHHLTH